MKKIKTMTSSRNTSFFIGMGMALVFSASISAQNVIEPPKGYSTDIGNMVAMLQDLKARVTGSVSNLSLKETDFLLDEDSNRIGAMIFHLAATEKYYQVYTFENRDFNEAETAQWSTALSLGDAARLEIKDQPITYYLDIWDEVRTETLRLLRTKDDDWFAAKAEGGVMNHHFAWYHVMEHQANHMGQIRFILKRIK